MNHASTQSQHLIAGEMQRLFYVPNYYSDYSPVPLSAFFAELSSVAKADTSSERISLLFAGAGEVIFEKLYVFPEAIDCGFIANDAEYKILLWNSSHLETVDITNIDIVNEYGLSFEEDNLTLQRNSDIQHTITVLKDGPALQDSKIEYTTSLGLFVVDITGKRILAWIYRPKRGGIKFRYQFQTVIWRNEYFSEQRRPIYPVPLREISGEFFERGDDQQRFIHDLRLLTLRILAVPIWIEAFRPNEDLLNATTINTDDSLNERWNLWNNCDFVLIRNRSSLEPYEIKNIVSVSENSIAISSPIAKDFAAGDTLIYPCFVGVIKSKSPSMHGKEMVGATVEFSEVFV